MIEELYKFKDYSPDLKIKQFNNIYIVYFETLCNVSLINDFILKPISYYKLKTINDIKNKLPNGNITEISDKNKLYELLFSGFTIVIINDSSIAVETKFELNSSIAEATNEKVIKGPKDAFTENYQINLGLIRKRIRSKDLVVIEHIIGTSSKSKVSLLYMDNIANHNLVNKIEKKLKNLNIDYIANSNYIYEKLDKENSMMPTNLMTERPDLVSFMLMEGRIAILTENTPQVIIIPAFFGDFIKNIDDYYQNSKNVSVTRFIRLIAFLIALLTPGLYIAITTFNQETLPTQVLINFSIQREGVPFPSIIEAIIMMISFEILREADTRIPYVIGTSMSIVGALVLGEAAVEAGLISPIMIIVIAISSVSSFLFNNNDVVNFIRIWKTVFLILGAFAGIYGIFIATLLFLLKLSSTESYGYDYTFPSAPFSFVEQKNNIFLINNFKLNKRNIVLSKKNFRR